MNVNEKIMSLGTVTGYPVAPDIYRGDSNKFIVFTYADERGALFGDDAEQFTTVKLYISLYEPESANYMADKHKIKKALIKMGFGVTNISSYLDDTLEGTEYLRRIMFEAEYTDKDYEII